MSNVADRHDPEKKSTPRLLSRREVSRLLRRTETQVRRYEGGRLRPIEVVVAGKRRVRYDPSEVAALREDLARRDAERARAKDEGARGWTEDEGRIAAAVFRLLDERRSLREIVVEVQVPPDVVRRLRAEHARTFEEDDRLRRVEGAARRERQEAREHAKRSATIAREEARARERRAARRSSRGAPDALLHSDIESDIRPESKNGGSP